MANKTIRFYGKGCSSSGGNCSVVVNFNGNVVYTGEIPTVVDDTDIADPQSQNVMLTFEVDEELFGTFPVTIETTAGDYILSSYADSTGAGTPADPTVYYVLTDVECTENRSNVTIDGIAQSKGPLADVLRGPWYWAVNNGSTLSYDLLVLPYGNIYPGNTTPT